MYYSPFLGISCLCLDWKKKYNTHKCVCEKAINEDEKTFGSFR